MLQQLDSAGAVVLLQGDASLWSMAQTVKLDTEQPGIFFPYPLFLAAVSVGWSPLVFLLRKPISALTVVNLSSIEQPWIQR